MSELEAFTVYWVAELCMSGSVGKLPLLKDRQDLQLKLLQSYYYPRDGKNDF